jgi:hypothetical protein
MTNQTTDAAGPSPREINVPIGVHSAVSQALSEAMGHHVVFSKRMAFIAALESAGYQITRQRAGVVEISVHAAELAAKALDVQGKLFEHNGIDPSSLIAFWNRENMDEINAAIAKARATGDGE